MKTSINEYKLPEWFLRWSGPFIIAIASVLGLIWSWGTWPDVLVDFGRELYVPWRLTEGDVVYRDIVWYYGPLSPYILALWFYCFGVSLQSLIIFNAIIMAGVLSLLYQIFSQIAGRTSATLSCLTFLSVFAFAQFVGIGNYNWMCPYSHGLTHGVALSLLSLYLVFRFARSYRFIWIGSAGFVLGLIFLMKIEVFMAALMGCIAGIATLFWLKRSGWKFLLKTVIIWIGLLILPILISFILFSFEMPPIDSLYATMGMLPHLFKTEHTFHLFNKWSLGTLNILESIVSILKWIGWYVLIFLPAFGLSLVSHRIKILPMRIAIITFSLVGSVLLLLWQWKMVTWYHIPRPWQVFMLLLGLIIFWKIIFRRSYDRKEYPVVVLRFAMVVFSLALLAKMIFNVRIGHYGFCLAMPATLMIVVVLWDWVPQLLRKLGGQHVVFRGAVLAAWLVAIAAHITLSDMLFSNKKFIVGTGADTFRADIRGYFINEAIKVLNEEMKPGDTLAVLPEGLMLNYQLRMQSPTPYESYLPGVFMLYNEAEILASFLKHPPDWVVLIHRDASEFGARFFGKDYGRSLWNWIAKNYTFTTRIGAMPFEGNHFGIVIGEKKTP